MARHVCPWWIGYFLISPLRRWLMDPDKVLAPYVEAGATVLEPGPGMGFFTLALARRVGIRGRVVALDVQKKMLDRLLDRAAQAGVDKRIEARLVRPESLGTADLEGRVDFVLACAVVHEMPSSATFFREAAAALKPGGRMLLAEPAWHVKAERFAAELEDAARAGLQVVERPRIGRSHSALLAKTGPSAT
jgi:SAM-dependent methyltransferase